MGKPGFRLGERTFMCSKRSTAMDGVYVQHVASLWRPIVAGDMLGYYSIVPGIGVGTGTFVVWSKRMPPAADGRLRYDPPGRFSQWPQPLELQGHAFGFDWWKNAVLRARAYNCQDDAEQVRVEAHIPRHSRPAAVNVCAETDSLRSKVMRKTDARATETVGRLKPAWEYLFVPSRRQRGRDKAGHGWRIRQLEPAEIASRFESTTEQVVQVSPDVCVAYPVQWLTAAVKPEYITVSLLQGSEVLCWQYLVEQSVLDSSTDGCHVQLPTAPALHSGEHLFDAVFGLLIHSGAIHDVVENIDDAILHHEVFDETQQQVLYDEH
jgi:hypothetical protein